MIQPIQFPNQYDVIREEAERFQKLDSRTKARLMEEMMQAGFELMAISPNKERNQSLMEDRERQGHLAHSRLFARIGVKHDATSQSVE